MINLVCIGGPLHGQTRLSDLPSFRVMKYVSTQTSWHKPPEKVEPIALPLETGTYRLDTLVLPHTGEHIEVWTWGGWRS
jgi:hypothetical protein